MCAKSYTPWTQHILCSAGMRGEAGDPREEFYTALRNKYYELIEYGNTHPQECQQNLLKLRQLLLLEGLPTESEVCFSFSYTYHSLHSNIIKTQPFIHTSLFTFTFTFTSEMIISFAFIYTIHIDQDSVAHSIILLFFFSSKWVQILTILNSKK